MFIVPAKVVSADVMRGDVLITFEDGTAAIYSAKLLHEVFHDAQEVAFPAEDHPPNP